MSETSFIIQNGRRLNLKDSTARKSIGSCSALQTDTKHCLVDAINEVNEKVKNGGGGSGEKGDPGATFTPSVDADGNLSWTNNGGLENPEPVNIKGEKGDRGETGAPGYTPVKNVDYFDGAPGADGKDGYTPVKGVDYFDGKDGKDGSPGDPGKDGTPCTHSWSGTTLSVTSASGTTSANLKGEKGATGSSGVHVGASAPTDASINLWIDPDGIGATMLPLSRADIIAICT